MWEAEQDRIVELEDLRRRQSRERVVTRGRRRLLLELAPQQPLHQPQGAVLGAMATAAVPDDELTLQVEGDGALQSTGRAVRGQGSQSEATDETLMGLQQEADLRGAVADAMGDAAGGVSVSADTSRRTNTPVGDRLRQVIDRQNAWRDNLEAERTAWSLGGARSRTTRGSWELAGQEDRGRFGSRAEARIALSPRRAFNVQEDHGRFLAQRMERLEQPEESRDRVQLREQTRRYDEDRENWRRQQEQMRRQQDEMNRQLLQLQQQLAAVRLQQQQQQVPQQPLFPNPPQPQQVAPQPPNPLIVPPPPNPPPHNPPVQPQPPPRPQPPVPQQPVQQPLIASPANWGLAPPQQPQGGLRTATPVGTRTPAGFTPNRVNRTDDDFMGDSRRHRFDFIDRKNLKLRTFKGKDIESWKSLFDDFAEEFQWSQAEKKLQLKAHVDDNIRSMFTGLPRQTTAEEMMSRLVSRYGVNMTATEVENEMLKIERKSGEDLYTLADRVRSLANRANLPLERRQAIMRQTFFTALRGNPEMQHWVNMYDRSERPDINVTLDLAIEWERQHGTVFKKDKVRQVESFSSNMTSTTFRSSDNESDSESVNKIDYIPIKEMTTAEAK